MNNLERCTKTSKTVHIWRGYARMLWSDLKAHFADRKKKWFFCGWQGGPTKLFIMIWQKREKWWFPESWGHPYDKIHFSRMRSKGSRCVCGRNRSQPFATVRNRPQPFAWGPYGRAYGKFYRGGPFWRFQTSGCFVSRGRRGTSWHSDVFCNVSKVVLRGRRNTFATFSEDVLQFSWQAQHFGRVHRHFSWQAQHFRRVLWRGFCKSHWQGLRQVVTSCKFRGRRGIFSHVLKNWRKPRTKDRFWGYKFSGSKENS